MTKAQAETAAQRFLDEHATSLPDDRRTLKRALGDFITHSERERKLRASTTVEYRRIANWLCARLWRAEPTWGDRPLDTFSGEDLIAVRIRACRRRPERESTVENHVRRIVRGAFGAHAGSPALAWEWMSAKVESEEEAPVLRPGAASCGSRPTRTRRLTRRSTRSLTEAGPRLSEISALKVRNVDFANGILRFEDGYTTGVAATPETRGAASGRCR